MAERNRAGMAEGAIQGSAQFGDLYGTSFPLAYIQIVSRLVTESIGF